MSKRKDKPRRQFAAIPTMLDPNGQPLVLLVTSRGSGRWIVPKGWPMANHTGRQVALQEAWEEAGITGVIPGKHPLGHFNYHKMLAGGGHICCRVEAFLMRVEREEAEWPEQAQRQRRWFTPREAAALVTEPELQQLIARLEPTTRMATDGEAALSVAP